MAHFDGKRGENQMKRNAQWMPWDGYGAAVESYAKHMTHLRTHYTHYTNAHTHSLDVMAPH